MIPRTKRITEFVGILYTRTGRRREPAFKNFVVMFRFNRGRSYYVIFGIRNFLRYVFYFA